MTLQNFRFLILYTVGRTPWTRDQPVVRPLPTYRTTDIHAISGIRTHDLSVQASEDSPFLRPRGHCDRLYGKYLEGARKVTVITYVNWRFSGEGEKNLNPNVESFSFNPENAENTFLQDV
ncbi:hypothetical protein B7P43_G13389 [Cryptotermes secundus]|uniref:Uncharacterized protein n=1 Tax=Cryptotermes secundus TaxID=105785 RepID=A0A2J7RKT4_9NEOP|nr:hypothetical protein B7P43_G13389 [Cryptotermes secundus]